MGMRCSPETFLMNTFASPVTSSSHYKVLVFIKMDGEQGMTKIALNKSRYRPLHYKLFLISQRNQ